MINKKLEILETNILAEYKSKDEYFSDIYYKLLKNNYVKEGYLNKLIDREMNYPTGLMLESHNIAIPHTEYLYSNVTGICVTTLKKPVKFRKMDDPEDEINVDIIIQILVDTSDKQVKMLQMLIETITNKEFLNKLYKSKSAVDIEKVFKGDII